MGLGLLNTSSISPQTRVISRTNSSSCDEETKQYMIENLVLPVGISMSDEKEVLSIVERLLSNRDVTKCSYAEKNITIANALVNNIKERANDREK